MSKKEQIKQFSEQLDVANAEIVELVDEILAQGKVYEELCECILQLMQALGQGAEMVQEACSSEPNMMLVQAKMILFSQLANIASMSLPEAVSRYATNKNQKLN